MILPLSTPQPAPGCKGELLIGKSVYMVAGDKGVGNPNLACWRTDDKGASWKKLGSVIVDLVPGADLGDGNLVHLRNGHLLAVYRRNHYHGEYQTSPEYGVHVSESSDGGKTWHLHSMIAQHRIERVSNSRGFWAPFLFVTRAGKLQCYYDDEYTPYERGFHGHQWVEMKTFDPTTSQWGDEVTVSRAPDQKELSRDGMATVIEPKPGHLVCTLESVSTTPPVVGDIREVTSDDGGKTWSWERGKRPVVYQAKTPYHSFSPWLIQGPGRNLFCLFATDEDNNSPQPAGTPAHRVRLDIKMVVSRDLGNTWSSPILVYAGTHHNYLPSGFLWDRKTLFASWIDFDKSSLTAFYGLPAN